MTDASILNLSKILHNEFMKSPHAKVALDIARDATINCDNNSQRIRLWMTLDEVKQKRAALNSIFKVVCERANV